MGGADQGVMQALADAGILGRKAGKGFFLCVLAVDTVSLIACLAGIPGHLAVVVPCASH